MQIYKAFKKYSLAKHKYSIGDNNSINKFPNEPCSLKHCSKLFISMLAYLKRDFGQDL